MADQNDNENIIISRIQQRRGLKQDIPQPLRPAEIGFTTDSRQVFIGADPEDTSATFNKSLSYFETTLSAKEHTLSIAENQVIAFTVPFIKYSKGKFDGISNLRQWEPEDARTSITVDIACEHISSDYSVFGPDVLGQYTLPVIFDIPGDSSITVSYAAAGFTTNPIQEGDAVAELNGNNISPAVVGVPITVSSVEQDDGSNCIVKLKGYESPTLSVANSSLLFTKSSITNFITGKAFTSSDVFVSQNGILCEPDPDAAQTVPRSAYDYALDASNIFSTGTHSLTMRAAPTPSDDVTLAYYSNISVLQALEGSQASDGKRYVSNNVENPAYRVESFYSQYNTPDYLKLSPELVRVSTTTGLGYMGLERKHISSIAFSDTISQTVGLTLGNLYVARDDEQFGISNISVLGNNTQQFTFTMDFASENVFSPKTEANADTTYRYNTLRFPSNPATANAFLQQVNIDVLTVDDANSIITIEVPAVGFSTTRTAAIKLANQVGNNYGNTQSTTITVTTPETAGVSRNDLIRFLDDSGNVANCEVQDVLFKVIDVPTTTSFNVAVSANNVQNYDFTVDNDQVRFVNHGNTTISADISPGNDPESSIVQLYSESKHRMITDPLAIEVLTSTNPAVFPANVSSNSYLRYDIDENEQLRDQDQKSIFIELNPTPGIANIAVTGDYYPVLDMGLLGDLTTVTPVLSIDLSGASTLNEVLALVNADLVTVKIDSVTDIPVVEDIFPSIGYVPGTTNELILKQDPSYSSVSVGGIEFTLFEDLETSTLSALGFEERNYGRPEDTIRGQLEQWLNDVVVNRNINLFSRVMTIGTQIVPQGNTTVAVPATYTPYTELPNLNPNYTDSLDSYLPYTLLVDDVFKEIQFCDRLEASNFNYIVNYNYNESLFDKQLDRLNGVRGLLNLKNNIEILTRESSILFGEREVTFPAAFQVLVLNEQEPNVPLTNFVLEATRYNTFIIDYTIVDRESNSNKYSRVGQMRVEARTDISTTDITVYDEFSSQYDIQDPPLAPNQGPGATIGGAQDYSGNPDNIFEPKFGADIVDNGIRFFLEENQDLVALGADNTAHSVNTDLVLRYVIKRWSSTDI